MTGIFACFRKEDVDNNDVKIVAVDLQAMAPIKGVTQIQGDITKVQKFIHVFSYIVDASTFLGHTKFNTNAFQLVLHMVCVSLGQHSA